MSRMRMEEVRLDSSADDNDTELDEYVFEKPDQFVELSIRRVRELNARDTSLNASVVALESCIVSLRPVVGDASLIKVSFVFRGEKKEEQFHEGILRFPAPLLSGGVAAFQEDDDSIYVCGTTYAGSVHRARFERKQARVRCVLSSALIVEAEEAEEAAEELTCASWIGSKYVAIGGSDSRLLRLCKLSASRNVWTFTQCRDATALDWIMGFVKREESAPMIAITGIRLSRTQHSIVSFGADFVLRVWSWTSSKSECVAQYPLAKLQKRVRLRDSFDLRSKLCVQSEKRGDLLVGIHVMTNADNVATMLTCNASTMTSDLVCTDLVFEDDEDEEQEEEDEELVSFCLDATRRRVWSLWSSNRMLCHRITSRSSLIRTNCISLGTENEPADGSRLPDPLEKAYERAQRIASRSHLDSLADADEERIKQDMNVSVEEMILLSSDLSDYFIRRLSEVNRFTREAVASGLDDFAHKSNLQRQQGRTHLSWSELFERSRRIVELRVRRDLERQGQDNSENAHHYAYLYRVSSWRELVDLCTAQQSECMRSLCITNGETSLLCGPVIMRAGLVSTVWPFRSYNVGPCRSIWNATKIMKLDEFTADELMRTDLGLSEDKDWIYEDEAEMRRAIEEYIDVLCSDSAEFSEVEVRACFDGISRPEEIFEEMLLLDDDDVDNEEKEEMKIPWISALCSAVICNLRRQYRFVRKTAVLLAYLHRAGVDWLSSSQNQIFSMCLRRLVKSRIMLRVASMRIVSLPHRTSVSVRVSAQQKEKRRLRVGQRLISQFVRCVTITEQGVARTTTRARQISSVQSVTSNLEKSTVSILDLVGSAVRVHFIATQYLHISSDSLLCSRLRVAIADSSLLLAQKTTRVLGSSAGIGSVEENFEDASSNFVQAVLLMRKKGKNKRSVRLCLDIAHAFNNLKRARNALEFAFLALDDKTISIEDAETVWELVVDINLSDDTMTQFEDLSYYDLAYLAIKKRRRNTQEDMLRLLNLLVDRRHLKWIVSDHSASSLWSSSDSSSSILAVLRDRVRSNRVHSSTSELLYATLIARGRYKEAAQHMFDLADSLNGLHDPENVRDGTMLSRRTRALLASMGALQLVPEDQAILRRQRKDSMKRCVPIVMKNLRFDLAVASCRETLFRHRVMNAKEAALLSPEACVSLAVNSEMYTLAFDLASKFPGDSMLCRVAHALAQNCTSLSAKGDEPEKCESRWNLLRKLLEKSPSSSFTVRKAVVSGILNSSHVVPVPHWLEGCFSGSNERHVIVEIPIQERRRITLASISEMMKRFGALETEPEWLSSSDKSVSVHFKSPISARAAVNTRNSSLLLRFADGTVSSGYKFGGQDASDPVSLIRSYLDRSLIREACDVAVETLESFESLSRRADNKQLPDQPLWIPEALLGELIWRACAACSVVYGTLNKWNEEKKAWYPRLCVGWRPETESHFVLEFSPHMGENGLGKIDLRNVQIRDLNVDETKEGETRPFSFMITAGSGSHVFSADNAMEKRKWSLALREMKEESLDDSSEAIVSLRTRIGTLRQLLSNVVSRRPIYENLRYEKRRRVELT